MRKSGIWGLIALGALLLITPSGTLSAQTPSGTLNATPNPCQMTSSDQEGCQSRIDWSSTNVATPFVQVRVNNKIFACTRANQTGSQLTQNWLGITSKTFTLHEATDCNSIDQSRPAFATVTVRGEYTGTPAGTIEADPSPCFILRGRKGCVTHIRWSSQNINFPAVQVRVNGRLFGCSKSNLNAPDGASQWLKTSKTTGDWIHASDYTFSLHAANDCNSSPVIKLDEVTVRGEKVIPNIILVVADDLDWKSMDPPTYLTRLKTLLQDEGTTFDRFFTTTPLCCPSRTTFLRSQYTHNHQVWSNREDQQGGFFQFKALGLEQSTLATWLQSAGYKTVLIGKYLNQYRPALSPEVPPGWNEWYAYGGGYFNYALAENGSVVNYRNQPEDYSTDVFTAKAVDFIHRHAQEPFFMHVDPWAPHGDVTGGPAPAVAPRHVGRFAGVPLPQSPAFNEADVSDKSRIISTLPPLDMCDDHGTPTPCVDYLQSAFQARLESMLSVEDMIENMIDTLRAHGILWKTYIIFVSDNGYHLGEHRFVHGKVYPYEVDARVPLIVRGPGIPKGATLSHLVASQDLPMTIAELAGAPVPSFTEGQSLLPLLNKTPPAEDTWRKQILLEAFFGEQRALYSAVRTKRYKLIHYRNIDEIEFYDLETDPYELNSLHNNLAFAPIIENLLNKLQQMQNCQGAECLDLEKQ